jgi:DNA-binding CsgD family transcriptional regulator
MERNRVARLSEGQRACLRMVYRHMETKEIARILEISPDGVAQRIKTAMRILGVHRRRDAARMLAEAEGIAPAAASPTYPPQVNPSWDIASLADAPMMGRSMESERPGHSAFAGRGLREEQMAYEAAILPPPGARLPFPLRETRPNDVGWAMRLAWIASIAIGGALAFGALAAGVEALARLFSS